MKFGRATRMIELCVQNIVNPIVVEFALES